MFELPESKLTWEVVGQWTAKDTDMDYSIIVKYQSMDGKPYRVYVMYFLKGYHLFIATLRCKPGVKDFESKRIIDLSKCSLMTEPVISRNPPGFLSITDRASYWGERFFFAKRSMDFLPPYHPAFELQFPESKCYYDLEEAIKFSKRIKERICKSNLELENE